jgi:hypothetical protein
LQNKILHQWRVSLTRATTCQTQEDGPIRTLPLGYCTSLYRRIIIMTKNNHNLYQGSEREREGRINAGTGNYPDEGMEDNTTDSRSLDLGKPAASDHDCFGNIGREPMGPRERRHVWTLGKWRNGAMGQRSNFSTSVTCD